MTQIYKSKPFKFYKNVLPAVIKYRQLLVKRQLIEYNNFIFIFRAEPLSWFC